MDRSKGGLSCVLFAKCLLFKRIIIMKTIKDLTVKVTYTVGLGNVEVPNKVYKQLEKMADYGLSIEDDYSEEYEEAFNWLSMNIKERDCYNWSYEVELDN